MHHWHFLVSVHLCVSVTVCVLACKCSAKGTVYTSDRHMYQHVFNQGANVECYMKKVCLPTVVVTCVVVIQVFINPSDSISFPAETCALWLLYLLQCKDNE